jgi:ribosomal protein L40E
MSYPTSAMAHDAQLDGASSVAAEVPCIYCRVAIAAKEFEFLSPGRRLVTAVCMGCNRTVTMRATSWRRHAARTLRVCD